MKSLILLGSLLILQQVSSQTAPAPTSGPVGFLAIRNRNLTSGTSLLTFDDVSVNDNNGFDNNTGTFRVPANSGGGLYWLHWSVGVPEATEVNVALIGASRAPNIVRRHTAFRGGPDTLSRSELIDLTALSGDIGLSSDYALYAAGDVSSYNSFLGFGLLNTMTTVVGFNLGRSTTTSTTGTIRYDVINVDTNSAYNATSGQYVIPVSGAYVLSVASATFSNATHAITVYQNAVAIGASYMYDTVHDDVDSVSSTYLVSFDAGDRLYTTLSFGPIYSDIRYQTSLQGFLFNPTGILPTAFSVANEQTYVGLQNPLPFDIVFLNQGNSWDIVTNKFRVRETGSGVYYVQMTAGIVNNATCRMDLLLNGFNQASIIRQSTVQNGVDTRSRAFLIRLITLDELQIRVPAGYRTYSNSLRVTKFSAMRIYG